MFTGCNDGKARAFDAKSGALKRTFPGHTAGINCIQYIEGKLFTGSSDGTLRVWDATNITSVEPCTWAYRKCASVANDGEDERGKEGGREGVKIERPLNSAR